MTDSDIKLKKFVYKKYKKQVCSFISKKAIVPNLMNIGLGAIIQSNVFLSDNSNRFMRKGKRGKSDTS